MEDGAYDIFGNPIGAGGSAQTPIDVAPEPTAAAPKKSGVGWTPPTSTPSDSAFVAGSAVEVKEGGNKWRAGVVTASDSKAKTVDVRYDDDGETEAEIPANLVRSRETSAPAPPAEPVSNTSSGTRGKEKSRVSRQAIKDSLKNPKVVSVLEILATMSDKELDAAVTMMRALDSVRVSGT